jgi:hypothetical protein
VPEPFANGAERGGEGVFVFDNQDHWEKVRNSKFETNRKKSEQRKKGRKTKRAPIVY